LRVARLGSIDQVVVDVGGTRGLHGGMQPYLPSTC
jgi:hypothetical protein